MKVTREDIKILTRDIVIVFIIFFLVSIFFKPILVKGISMEPTLESGDYLIMGKQAYAFSEPKRGDLVVCRTEKKEEKKIVKRIIGLPGEKIKVWENLVYINGDILEEDYINNTEIYKGIEETTVPKDSYFVMGDNRNHSVDSRNSIIGFVKKEDIVGEIVFRVFPFKKFGGL